MLDTLGAAGTSILKFLTTPSGLNNLTVAAAILCIFIRPLRMKLRKCVNCWSREKVIFDFFNGLSLVPFAAMPLSLLENGIMTNVQNNHVVLASAGIVGLIFVGTELIKAGDGRDPAPPVQTSVPSPPAIQTVTSGVAFQEDLSRKSANDAKPQRSSSRWY